jgi:hypothetical protein
MGRIAFLLIALSWAAPGCGGGGGGDGAPDSGTGAIGWTYQEIAGAACGNGSPWGVATSIQPGASEVVVFLAGGGACWDVESCYVIGSAVHIDEDLGAATVMAQARTLEGWFFSRAAGPFTGASYVYLPYCTGDLHAGRRVTDHRAPAPATHHVGGENLDRLLARWDAIGLPAPDRLWLTGISAGGFGATLNWWRFRERFPEASAVHVIDDSGPPIDVPSGRFGAWVAAWDLVQPPGCADCGEGLSRLLPHYRAAGPPEDRYAYLGFEHDAVISLFWGDGVEVIAAKHAAMRTVLEAEDRFGGFFLAGGDHVVLAAPSRATSGGLTAATWLGQFIAGSPDWTTVGP